ncbi:MAG: EamA family transporter [Candidatus Gracilibacteria bacterium]|nr:EamA family transporter [Candidatus Gracilibacteria bacterium]
MLGSALWYIGPKIFPTINPFTPVLISGLMGVLIGLIGSKLAHGMWFDARGIPLGLLFTFTWITTIGLVLALNAGGKIGPVSVIVELSVLFAAGISLFWFREHLNPWQILGIIMATVGVALVVAFER